MRHIIASAAVLGCLAVAGPASAHAHLKAATPAADSTVAAPKQVTITFTEGVEPRFSTIAVQDATGASVTAGDAHLDGPNTQFAVPLKTLAAGTYKVVWHATAVDTHKTEGSFSFTVSP